jgi:hypothetical protein
VYARANQWRLLKLLRVLQAGHIQMRAFCLRFHAPPAGIRKNMEGIAMSVVKFPGQPKRRSAGLVGARVCDPKRERMVARAERIVELLSARIIRDDWSFRYPPLRCAALLVPRRCASLPFMGAILEMPPEVRAAHFSRELDRFVIEALRAVKRQGGEQAFNRTARDLVISVCAILAYERGTDVVVGMFDVIERVLADDQ